MKNLPLASLWQKPYLKGYLQRKSNTTVRRTENDRDLT